MLTKRIIPCLDVTNGRVVKGTQFLDLKDAGDPIKLAQFYNKQGADELVFLDITASSDKRAILLKLVNACAKELFIPFTVGGGINSIETIKTLLHAGADKVSINSAALTNPSLISDSSQQFGTQCIVVAIDAKKTNANASLSNTFYQNKELCIDTNSCYEIYTHGGRKATGVDAIKWAKYVTQLGAGELLVTSMDEDGKKNGYDLDLLKQIKQNVNVPVIASGGAGNANHVSEALKHCDAALLASILHFKQTNISAIKQHCHLQQLPIRL